MAISLYDASVLCYLQTLDAMSGILERGLAHCRDNGIDPETIVETRLWPDMRPFGFQIQWAVVHSLGAVDSIRSGILIPSGAPPALDYAALQALVTDARNALRQVSPEEINAREGAEIVLQVRDTRRLFTAEGFLLSFSLPNFHFHTTTAYDILRSKGVPVGKLDYIGALRLKA